MIERFKYPRTAHLPWSLGKSDDDIVSFDFSGFLGHEIVITEKMDGENTTLYQDGFHARSVDSRHHPSRNWLANFHSHIAYLIPEDIRICGENLYARHSIAYDELESYFLGFSAWRGDTCLSWDDTLEIFSNLGITPVRQLYRGKFNTGLLKNLSSDIDVNKQEGYVVRIVDSFPLLDFQKCVRKFVRKDHVTTDQHWQHQSVVPNKIKNAAQDP